MLNAIQQISITEMDLKHHWYSANEIDFVAAEAVTIVVDANRVVQSGTNSFEYTNESQNITIRSLEPFHTNCNRSSNKNLN